MKLKELQLHLLRLAVIEEKADPFVSCYLNPEPALPATFEEKVRALRAGLPETSRASVDEALAQLRVFIAAESFPKDGGIAAFARGGQDPFFLGLRLKAPLPSLLSVGPRPQIYPLIEIRDNYDHYVVLYVTDTRLKILAVDLGAATEELVKSRPELRRREGREWTRQHFLNHRRERTRQFIRDGVRILGNVMSSDWYKHFILAGEPRAMAEVRRCLTRSLESMLVAAIPYSGDDHPASLTALTLPVFRDFEERESQRMVEKLLRELATNGHGVAGPVSSLAAIRRRQVQSVVMAKDYQLGIAWQCTNCDWLAAPQQEPLRCPDCRAPVRPVDLKEEIARSAVLNGCGVEIVGHSDELMRVGGVGCLLRYLGASQFVSRMTA